MASWADDSESPVRAPGEKVDKKAVPAPRHLRAGVGAPRSAPGLQQTAGASRRSRNTQTREQESSAGGPDFGTEVDWRLSRVRQEDLPPPRARATTSSREPPLRVVTATADLPPSLAARLVLPGLPKAPLPGQQRDEEVREGQQRRVQRGEASCDLRVVRNSRGPAEPRPKASLVVSVQSDGHGGAVRKVTGASVPAPPPAPAVGAASAQWLYRDPKGVERGPNTTAQLLSWYRAGFYQSTLPVQRVGGEGTWTTLGDALLAPGHLPPSPTPKPLPKPLTQARSEATAPRVQPEPPAAAAAVPPAPAAGEPAAAVEAVGAQEAEAAEAVAEEAAIGWDAAAVQNAHRLFGNEAQLWIYRDTSGDTQGPFGSRDMLAWLLAGYLHSHELPVANATAGTPQAGAFRPLADWLGSQ